MYRMFAKLLKPCRNTYLTAIIITFFAALTAMVMPLITRFTIDYVLSGPGEGTPAYYFKIAEFFGGQEYLRQNIWICVLMILGISLVNVVLTHIRSRLSAYGAEIIAKNHKDSLYDHLQKLPYDYHVKAQTGDLIQRCTSDVDTVRKFLATQFIDVFRIIFLTVIILTILIVLNPLLALASVSLMPILFLSSGMFLKNIRKSFKAADIKEGELSTVIQENLSGVRVVRAFGREAFELDKFKKYNKEFKDLCFINLNQMAIYWGATDLLCIGQIGVVMLVGTYMAYTGSITIGTLIAFNIYVNNLVWPLRQLGRIISNLGRTEVSLGRINEILNTPQERDNAEPLEAPLRGEIVFDKVSFGYEKGQPVLKDLSFKAAPGETIAILGPTGAGKSSLMHLFLRLYDYQKGSITINGRELREIQKIHLRRRIGIVLQEPFLYSKTIRENIKMAKDIVTDEEVYAAAKIANIHDVIEEFNDGYETMVGERGVTLSGGQKQRVAIARTLVKDSDILIFDDSLSAVDTETDAQIRKALKKKSKGVTTFIISQRITTLMHADRIFVLENGALTDQGTHEELITRDGLYRRIWDIQHMLEETALIEEV